MQPKDRPLTAEARAVPDQQEPPPCARVETEQSQNQCLLTRKCGPEGHVAGLLRACKPGGGGCPSPRSGPQGASPAAPHPARTVSRPPCGLPAGRDPSAVLSLGRLSSASQERDSRHSPGAFTWPDGSPVPPAAKPGGALSSPRVGCTGALAGQLWSVPQARSPRRGLAG